MNRNIAKLLGQYLRSAAGGWLCAALAVQFLVTSAVWALGVRHEFLPGVLLLAIAQSQSAPARSLAWRVLPITRKELSLANWWATTLLPALTLSCALVLALPSNRSAGWPIPSGTAVTLQLAGVCAAFGYTAWLALRMRMRAEPRTAPRLLVTWTIPLLAALYGYPLGRSARAPCIVIITIGCALFVLSFLRASSGRPLPAPPLPARHAPQRRGARSARAAVTGWRLILFAVSAQTAWMLGLALGGSCLLRLLYPRAAEALLWAFLAAAAVWSALAAERWSRSLWLWRCLPLTMRRATLALQAAQLLPLGVTMLAAWALGRLAPQVALPMPGWLPAASVALVAWANVQARLVGRRQRAARRIDGWLAAWTAVAFMSFLLPAQVVAKASPWMAALIWAVAAALLLGSFRMTLTELRSAEPIGQFRMQPQR